MEVKSTIPTMDSGLPVSMMFSQETMHARNQLRCQQRLVSHCLASTPALVAKKEVFL